MKQVAKVLVVDPQGHYLLLRLNNHPRFLNGPDLPGGTADEGETTKAAAIREVQEEAGIDIKPADMVEIYSGSEYSKHATWYSLYTAQFSARPEVTLSWEHISFEWVSKETLLEESAKAHDSYMRMVHSLLRLSSPE